MKTALVVATRVTRPHVGETYTDGLIVHEITKGVIVTPSQKSTYTMQHLIKKSTVAM